MLVSQISEWIRKLENAKQATMSFVAEVIPPACWIIYSTIDFYDAANEGGPELPCMTGIKKNESANIVSI